MSRAPLHAPIASSEISDALNVSRETADKIQGFMGLVEHWTKAVNLISKDSINALWDRHILDSAQLYSLAPNNTGHWLDMGSGAGFPAIVCALLAQDASARTRFTLVESDRRKGAFLATANRELDLSLTIRTERIEKLDPQHADVVSARALATLTNLFSLAEPHLAANAILLFPKGATFDEEIRTAAQCWRFTHELHPSITHPEARILRCSAPQRI